MAKVERGGAARTATLEVYEPVLRCNDEQARENRALFGRSGVGAVNIVSSPGSGKTALLERTLTDLAGVLRLGVIVGDLATENDARRLQRAGAPCVQITTGDVCHLDAGMIARALTRPDFARLTDLDLVIIENVGNLVCPCAYDLGEDLRVVLLSVTEGEDKPLKYPNIFKSADVVIVTKTDIADVVEFDRERALEAIRGVAPQAEIVELSARAGIGMAPWYDALRRLHADARSRATAAVIAPALHEPIPSARPGT